MEGYVTIEHPKRNGKHVAVIGSGPSGLATANQLNYKGYEVTVFDKNEAAGGLLRYGIPNFKLNKAIIDRRINVMEQEGITFVYNCNLPLGNDDKALSAEELNAALKEYTPNKENWKGNYDAIVIATGTPEARDLKAPGRELKGIHLALELLGQQNRVLAGKEFKKDERITAKGKKVLVIGGGDTGSDCIGTAHRQGCKCVTQIEIMPKPPVGHNPATPWPNWPVILKTTSSHEEGCDRRWLLNTNRFIGDDNGNVKAVEVEGVIWEKNPDGGRPIMKLDGKKEIIEADLVLLAMGFLKPTHPQYPDNIFVCGDAANGASLVVRAIASGRQTAEKVHSYLSK